MLHRNTKHRLSLRDLINTIEWTAVQSSGMGRRVLSPESVAVQFTTFDKKTAQRVDYVRIRVGREVMNELGWEPGDKITPAFHPDDQMLFLLVKAAPGNGYTLSLESKSSNCCLSFKWNRDQIPLMEMKTTEVEHEVHQGKLIFRVSQDLIATAY